MGKRKAGGSSFGAKAGETKAAAASQEKGLTLKDALGADVLAKLKAQAEELKAQEARERERQRVEAEERRKQEQKRLENDFEHLLNNSSMDWKKYK
ncbi:YqkE family protein [Paenibacillus sp.]|uniref:YqkE family protein n=1 Tax=Paenibacillus sp. TaxID=58172 RepID=UPI002D679B7A|nr:YqkE family protein [Paenibacillus sp.]HZG88409.1 YqkE family protein [Paenibacillus sp.]